VCTPGLLPTRPTVTQLLPYRNLIVTILCYNGVCRIARGEGLRLDERLHRRRHPHAQSTRPSAAPCRRTGSDTQSAVDDATQSPMGSGSGATRVKEVHGRRLGGLAPAACDFLIASPNGVGAGLSESSARFQTRSHRHKLPRAIGHSYKQHMGQEIERDVADPGEMSECPPTEAARAYRRRPVSQIASP
jgi:hypothetical protein